LKSVELVKKQSQFCATIMLRSTQIPLSGQRAFYFREEYQGEAAAKVLNDSISFSLAIMILAFPGQSKPIIASPLRSRFKANKGSFMTCKDIR
jgi:hypothetical protein